jgi:hypothetical protein
MKLHDNIIEALERKNMNLYAKDVALAFANWLFRCPYIIGENASGKIIGYRVKTGEQFTIEQLFNKWRKHETNNL